MCCALPSYWLTLILPFEPDCERLEIIHDRRRIQLPFSSGIGEDLLPRLALSRRQHAGQLLTGGMVTVDRAAVQRSAPTCGSAPRPMQLELQDARQEIAHVRNVRGDMEFRAGI